MPEPAGALMIVQACSMARAEALEQLWARHPGRCAARDRKARGDQRWRLWRWCWLLVRIEQGARDLLKALRGQIVATPQVALAQLALHAPIRIPVACRRGAPRGGR